MSTDKDVAHSSTRGTIWNGLAYSASKLALFPATVILARLLTPESFGLLALALLVLTYFDTLRDFGISAGLIQRSGEDGLADSVAFWLCLMTGAAATLAVILLAPLLAAFFDEPALTLVIRVLAITLLVDGAASVFEAILRKRLEFRRRVGPELGRALAKSTTSIAMALVGAGVWSLVAGQIVGSLIGAALYARVTSWVPELRYDKRVARSLLRYGKQIFVLALLAVIVKDIDYMIIGKRLAAEALGYYSLAFRFPEMIILGICYVFSQTAFPVFAKVKDDREQLLESARLTLHSLMAVTLPLGVGIALVAPELVKLFYSEKWLPAVEPMRWLALYATVSSVGFVAGDVYKATARVGILNLVVLVKFLVTVPVLWLAAGYGIHQVALAQLGIVTVTVWVELMVARRVLSLEGLLRDSVSAPLLSSALMAGAVIGMAQYLPSDRLILRLAVMAFTGAVTYAVAMWIFDRKLIMQVIRFGPLKLP